MPHRASKFENGILYFTPKGKRTVEFLIEEIQASFSVVPNKVDTLFILSDLTQVNFNFSLEEIERISNATLAECKKFRKVYDCLVGSSPEELTNILYFESMSLKDNYVVKVCHSKTEAKKWIEKQRG